MQNAAKRGVLGVSSPRVGDPIRPEAVLAVEEGVAEDILEPPPAFGGAALAAAAQLLRHHEGPTRGQERRQCPQQRK